MTFLGQIEIRGVAFIDLRWGLYIYMYIYIYGRRPLSAEEGAVEPGEVVLLRAVSA